MKELSEELRTMAREQGLCDQWFGEWKDDSDDETLFDKYKRGIDFCIKHEYPSLEYIRSHWDEDELEENGIFVDAKGVTVRRPPLIAVVNGESEVTFDCGDFDVSDIYVRHNSRVRVVANGHARIMINLYDGASATVDCGGEGRVYVSKHGTTCLVEDVGENESRVHYCDAN
jgi:hypothetical protein